MGWEYQASCNAQRMPFGLGRFAWVGGERALSPRQRGVKAAQDGEKRQSSSHPAVTLERAHILRVCSSVKNESLRVQSPTDVQS